MIGARIEMDEQGRVTAVYIHANSEQEEIIVKGALARIASPSAWRWLPRLFRRCRLF